jgi:hypothetical protein
LGPPRRVVKAHGGDYAKLRSHGGSLLAGFRPRQPPLVDREQWGAAALEASDFVRGILTPVLAR